MPNEPLALQKANELRSAVADDSEMAEMVDTLATVLMLKQDLSDPMYGAKVTYHDTPEGEWVDIDYDTYRDLHQNAEVLPDDPEDAYSPHERLDRMTRHIDGVNAGEPWWLRWKRVDGDRDKRLPEGEHEHRFKQYKQWTGTEELDESEVPDEILNADGISEKESVAAERDGEEWTIYRVGTGEDRHTVYKRDKLVPFDSYVQRRGIVVEPHIADQPSGTEFWDPNREEYTTPEDYPMGTVNIVVPEDSDEEFGEDYVSSVKEVTSVVPAEDPDSPRGGSYTPGWE